MSYATLLESEVVENNFLCVLKPRRRVTTWTSLGSGVYSCQFTLGFVGLVTVSGEVLTLASSSSVSAGEFYYDDETRTVYAKSTGSLNLSTEYSVLTYEIYVGTVPAHFYRIPTDNTSQTVYFNPIVKRAPSVSISSSDSALGFIPTKTSSISLNNAEHSLEVHLSESSFSSAEIEVYHSLGDLEVANCKKLFKAFLSDITVDSDSVEFKILDSVDVLSQEFRNGSNDSYFNTVSFPNVDPSFIGRPIRYVYGEVAGFVPVNIDYSDTPTTSNNRNWVACSDQGISIEKVTIIQGGVAYYPQLTTDYTVQNFAEGTRGIQFTASMETNLTMAVLNPTDRVFLTVRGKQNDVTLSASPFGSDDVTTNNLTHPVVILIDLLKRVGVSESEINIAEFIQLETEVFDAVGFAIPQSSYEEFPKYKEIISDICKSSLLILTRDNDSKWTVDRLKPIGTISKTIDDLEIIENSFSSEVSYFDIYSDIIVEYGRQEISDNINQVGESVKQITQVSSVAKYLHKVNKTHTQRSLHFKEVDAQLLCDRLSFLFGDRKQTFSFDAKNKFINTRLAESFTIEREKLSGFNYVEGVLNQIQGKTESVSKNLRLSSIVVTDQKGIEDNSANWDVT